ncbi:sugar ABC transporter substrate-binding protein [Halopelagius fulvigenes]|uniref:Sugar ABC transporter substrate-binding protein n=1 Tax=Halopelagius fulvigenes TaxID=1198324 RepID=A0ABD5TXX5_9EURY
MAGCAGGGGDGSSGGDGTGTGGGDGSSYDQVFATAPTLENDYWGAFAEGYKTAANAWSLNHDIQANGASTSDMLSQFDSAVTGGADAVVGTASKDSGVPSLADAAGQAGVPFVEMWAMGKWYTPLDAGEHFVQYNIPEPVRTGALTARILFEAMGGKGNFVHVTGLKGTVGANGRNMGVEEAMKDYPNIKRLGDPLPGDWNRQKSRESMQSFVSRFGDKIDGVYAQNDTEAQGVLTVCQENNLNVPIVGYDGIQETVEAIQNPPENGPRIVATFTSHPPWQAGWALAKTYDWHNGWRPKTPERMMFSGGSLVVKEPSKWKDKIDHDRFLKPQPYLDAVFGSEDPPYDWKKMSVVESGEDAFDPQNKLVPIRKSDFYQLLWTEDNKPSGYSLPEEYNQSKPFDEVEQTYADRWSDPYA